MRLSFLPGGLLLVKTGDEYVITIEDEEVFRSKLERKAIQKFNGIRKDMEQKYPATGLTKEQKQEALKRLIGDYLYTQVRNTMKKSKFEKPKFGKFDNRK
jgi:hypothetical protein